MPIFSYQSFNANSSHTHDLKALTVQRFTADTHANWAGMNGQAKSALVYPVAAPDPAKPPPDPVAQNAKPVMGPANLVPTAPAATISRDAHGNTSVDTGTFLGMMQSKVLQNRQALYREMGGMADVTAFGELDSTHADFAQMPDFAGHHAGSSSNKKANQNFSVFANNSGNVVHLGDGEGWFAIDYLGYVVVFVHVPNRLAKATAAKPKARPKSVVISGGITKSYATPARQKKASGAKGSADDAALVTFYKDIHNRILQKNGRVIDVIMGDTNQGSSSVTPEAVSEATNYPFKDAHDGAIFPIDTFGLSVKGTNSNQEKMYDVAVYNAATVKLEKVCYWTQQAPFGNARSVAAVTDHMGLAVKVEKLTAQQ